MSSAVSAGDLILYRTHPQVANSYLWVDKPPAVYRGQVNQVAAFTYPITAAVPFDNGSGTIGDVQIDMLVTFGATVDGDDLGRTRVLGITGTTLGIPRISQGTVDGTVKLSNDIYFTIWDTYPPAPKIPFFDEATQTFFKDGDDVFVAALPPVANIGYAHIYADLVNSSDKLVLTIDSTDSFSPISGTLTRLWDVEDGTITSGSTSSTAITVEFPVGRRQIKLTLTDTTNSRATIRHLLVVACKLGDANYAPILDAKAGTLTQTVEGLRQSFTFGQDIVATTYLDGVAVCYFQREFYGTTEDALHDSTPVKFAGWHRTDPARLQAQATHELTEVTLDCVDTAGVLAQLPGFPQTIESASSPLRWEQMASPNLDKFLAYLWLYHSTASNLVDFTWSATTTTYPFVRLNSLGNSLYGQIDGRARAIGYRLLSNVKGRCKVKKDSMLFDSGSRDSVNVISLTESDIVSITYTHQRPPRSHWNRGNAIVASSSTVNAVFCIAPGVVPSWGLSAGEIGENLVASQTELNARVGHAYARENAPEGYVEVELLHAGDLGLEPLDFVRITLSSDYAAQRGLTWTTQRFAVVAINTDYDPVYGTKRIRLTLEKEIFGTPAETVIPPDNPLPVVDSINDLYPADDTVAGTGTLAALTFGGTLYTTSNFNTPSGSGGPTWTSTALSLTGTVQDFVVDAYSPLYVSGSGAVNGWILTTQRIYRIADIFGTPTLTSRKTLRATSTSGRIEATRSVQNHVVAVSYYTNNGGIYATYTTDDSTYTEVQITSHYFTVGAGRDLALYVSEHTAGLVYAGAFLTTGTTATSDLYKSVDYGATWAQVTGNPVTSSMGSEPGGGLHVPFHDNASDLILYWNRRTDDPSETNVFIRTSTSTETNITPASNYGPRDHHAVSSNPLNRQQMLACLTTETSDNYITYASDNAGDTWTALTSAATRANTYTGCSVIDSGAAYLWGGGGRVGYSADRVTIDERGPGGGSEIVGICGGDA